MMKILYIISVLLLATTAYSKTIELNTLDQDSIKNAINDAHDGDVIRLPAGTGTWSTPGHMQPAILIHDKTITLMGAGAEKTIIHDATGDKHQETMLLINNGKGFTFRISGIHFMQDAAHGDGKGIIHVEGETKDWRIDHCRFTATSGNIISVGGWNSGFVHGVIDNNQFRGVNNTTLKAFQISSKRSGETENTTDESKMRGGASWSAALALGSENAVYIEDNSFDWDTRYTFLDADEGARVVVRHNAFKGVGFGTHGHDGGYKHRSVFSYEIYNNTFDDNAKGMWAAVGLRGGTGVIFGNLFSGTFSASIKLYCYCACDNPRVTCDAWPVCTYPCPDQVGRTTGQQRQPLYAWANEFTNGAPQPDLFDNGGKCDEVNAIFQEGRDYFFDLNTGPRSNRPQTCQPGEAYWSTDAEALDKCIAADQWQDNWYRPYAYPHPVRSAGTPEAPTGLTIL